MDQIRSLQALGIVFLACGASFLAVGVTTKMLAFSALGPAFIALGVVFLATSKARSRVPATEHQKPKGQDSAA